MINTDLSRLKEWRAIRGFDNQFTLTFLLDSAAFDVSSYTFTVNIRKIGSDTNVLQLTEGNGVTNGGASGIVTILLDDDASQTISSRGYFYEIIYVVGSFSNRLLQGTFNLLDDYNSASPSESATIPVNLEGTDVNLVINLAGGSGSALQFQNEGSDLGTPDVDTLDFVGALITAARVGDKVTVTVTTPTKSDVGLDNVDNTSDVNKPVSTAQAAADAVVLATATALANSKVDSVTGDGVNNADPNNPVIDLTQSRTVTGTDSIVQADSLKVIYFNSATPFNFTIDQLNADSQTSFVNIGAGTVTFVAGSGVTISGITSLSGGTNATAVILYRTATNPVIIAGATTVSGAALTKTDDTNVTLTLGGTPATALLQATSLTLGWTGTLAYARFVDGSALSVVGRASNTSGVQASIVAANDFEILRRSGTSIGFGSIDLSQSGAVGSSILPIANGGTGATSFPGWLLASGGTLTGVNTITHTNANGLIFTGAPTFSATGHYHTQWTASPQFGSNASHLQGLVNIAGSPLAGVNSQVMNGLVVNPTPNFGAFTKPSYWNRALAVLGTNNNGFGFFIDSFTNTNNILRITDPSGVTTGEIGTDASGLFFTSNAAKTIFMNSGSNFRLLLSGTRVIELATTTLDVSRTIFGPAQSGTPTSTATQLGSNAHLGFQSRLWNGAAAVTANMYWTFDASTSVNLTGTSDLKFWNGSTTTNIWRIAPVTSRISIGAATDPNVTLDVNGGIALRATSPAQITSNQNDYAIGSGTFFRLSTDASRNITSITGGADGKQLIIVNVGSQNIVFTHDDGATGTAANRILSSTAGNLTVAPNGSITLIYDATTARWRDIAIR